MMKDDEIEKIFYTKGKNIKKLGLSSEKNWAVAIDEHNAKKIADAMNELTTERNELQFQFNMKCIELRNAEERNESLENHIIKK